MKPLAVSGVDGLGQAEGVKTFAGIFLVALAAWWVYKDG